MQDCSRNLDHVRRNLNSARSRRDRCQKCSSDLCQWFQHSTDCFRWRSTRPPLQPRRCSIYRSSWDCRRAIDRCSESIHIGRNWPIFPARCSSLRRPRIPLLFHCPCTLLREDQPRTSPIGGGRRVHGTPWKAGSPSCWRKHSSSTRDCPWLIVEIRDIQRSRTRWQRIRDNSPRWFGPIETSKPRRHRFLPCRFERTCWRCFVRTNRSCSPSRCQPLSASSPRSRTDIRWSSKRSLPRLQYRYRTQFVVWLWPRGQIPIESFQPSVAANCSAAAFRRLGRCLKIAQRRRRWQGRAPHSTQLNPSSLHNTIGLLLQVLTCGSMTQLFTMLTFIVCSRVHWSPRDVHAFIKLRATGASSFFLSSSITQWEVLL